MADGSQEVRGGAPLAVVQIWESAFADEGGRKEACCRDGFVVLCDGAKDTGAGGRMTGKGDEDYPRDDDGEPGGGCARDPATLVEEPGRDAARFRVVPIALFVRLLASWGLVVG